MENEPAPQIITGGTDEPQQPTPQPQKKESWRSALTTIFLFAGALITALLINAFAFQSYVVNGTSMQPTLNNSDRLIILKAPKTWSKITRHKYIPARGDIIVFHKPGNEKEQLIKRVIALPGERVEVIDGVITVYNQDFPDGFKPDDAEYGKDLPEADTSRNTKLTVPDNEVFVSGDNRSPGGSFDSRTGLGTIPVDYIVGKLIIRIFPVNDASFF